MVGTTATVDDAAVVETPAMDERSPGARRVVLLAAGIGLLGQLLFFDVAIGLNFPIAVAALLVCAYAVRAGRPALTDAWIAPAAVLFAAFAAVRADPFLVFLDVLTSLGLTLFALANLAGAGVVASAFATLIRLAGLGVRWIVGGAAGVIGTATRSLRAPLLRGRAASHAAPVFRGLVIALPVVLLFVVLFSSADAVFASLVRRVFDIELDLAEALGRVLLTIAIAWLAAGALGLVALRRLTPPNEDHVAARSAPFAGVGIEALVVLWAVDAVFGVFVALQAAYLFGGLDTMQAVGLTYAEYARRGYFELVAVVVLAGSLIVGLDRLVGLRSPLRLVAACVLTLLAAVVLASAALRLGIYQQAYGWTELRLYVLASIVLFAIGLVGLLAALLTDRVRWIGHLLVGAALVIGLGLNVLGPSRFITEQNVARILNPELVPPTGHTGFDEGYTLSLGDDAVPALLRALPALSGKDADAIGVAMTARLHRLQNDDRLTAWQAWNLGRAGARAALERAQAEGRLR